MLLEYDYSKSSDPLQPFAAHITSLLTKDHPRTADVLVAGGLDDSFHLHKFILSARSPYFARKLAAASDVSSLKLPSSLPPQAFSTAISYLYFGEAPSDVGGGPGTGFSEEEVLQGIDKISKHIEIRTLLEDILEGSDRRYARQRRLLEVERGRDQIEKWFNENVIRHRVITNTENAENVRWDRSNSIFADVLLRADDPEPHNDHPEEEGMMTNGTAYPIPSIPVGPLSGSRPSPRSSDRRRAVLFPVHRAMLLRSEYFSLMFSSSFREAQSLEYLQIIEMDCLPEVLETVLRYLYTEKTEMPLNIALDVLYAADLLLIEKLKMKAATTISTLGHGRMSQIPLRLDPPASEQKDLIPEQPELDVYEIIRAGWQLRVPRLEEFGARFIAFRLEAYIDDPDFEDIVKESAGRIQKRQETDTIELLDDIRYYLSERFRLRFEDAGIEEMIDQETEAAQAKGWDEQQPGTATIDEGPPKAATTQGGFKHVVDGEPDTPMVEGGRIRTLDGEEVDDELEGEAMNYQILLAKIDRLLEKLKLDA